ncbi:MAG: hypothetical protein QJR02_01420 [Sinobacteraceae bacterium]|nr:hypothetical protein [Nevskiaceae bacterium]
MLVDWTAFLKHLESTPSGSRYAGIGARETPADVCLLMTRVATKLARRGMILRSGGARGADAAFEAGVSDPNFKEIYLPWKGFAGNSSTRCGVTDEARRLAEQFHPRWSSLRPAAQLLVARNGFQVLGADLQSPSAFVLCWTKNGEAVGGTGQAIRIALARNIPVFNLFDMFR